MAIAEIISASTEPINKLIEAVSGAIGKAYEPRHIRKIAEAKAYEISVISEELRNNSDVPIVYNGNEISISTSNYEELAKRAGNRLAFQEIAKQANIEAVIDNAYMEIEGKENNSDETVNKDWVTRLINSVEDISDSDMQKLWGKILAREVLEPNTISFRTLECMRNMGKVDAELFQRVCEFVIGDTMVINDDEILEKMGVSYRDILSLDECGLINSSGIISSSIKITNESQIIMDFGSYILVAKYNGDFDEKVVHIQQYPLSKSGRDISHIIEKRINIKYYKLICEKMRKENQDCVFSVHKVISRNGTQVQYEILEQ